MAHASELQSRGRAPGPALENMHWGRRPPPEARRRLGQLGCPNSLGYARPLPARSVTADS
eukprot:4414308-Alexandrium_andersonii.AAC.1